MHMQGGKRSCAALEAARGWRRLFCRSPGRREKPYQVVVMPSFRLIPRESRLKLPLGSHRLLKSRTTLAKV